MTRRPASTNNLRTINFADCGQTPLLGTQIFSNNKLSAYKIQLCIYWSSRDGRTMTNILNHLSILQCKFGNIGLSIY